MDLYEKIKELAAQKHVSIRQIEETLKIANGTIRRWNTTNPSTGTIAKVADYFHVSVDYLLGREKQEGEHLNEDEGQLLGFYRLERQKLSKEEQQKFQNSVMKMMKLARELAEDETNWE